MIYCRKFSSEGLTTGNASNASLIVDKMTSKVVFNSTSNDGSQVLEFIGGKLWNRKFQKFISVNNGIVRADNNDTRGASAWTLGQDF
jgi:hypothetical protein